MWPTKFLSRNVAPRVPPSRSTGPQWQRALQVALLGVSVVFVVVVSSLLVWIAILSSPDAAWSGGACSRAQQDRCAGSDGTVELEPRDALGTCVAGAGGNVTCRCASGAELVGAAPDDSLACRDVDECAGNPSPCGELACVNSRLSYRCRCETGYSPVLVCKQRQGP